MIYLAGTANPSVRPRMLGDADTPPGSLVPAALRLGVLDTYRNRINLDALPGVPWAADNCCFPPKNPNAKPWRWDVWWRWLESRAPHADRCLFAVAPDVVTRRPDGTVVGNADATLDLSCRWFDPIRTLGFRVAFVLQDGARPDTVPWDRFDALFVGGSDALKVGPVGAAFIAEAKARGKWVHMGRVNTKRRLRIAYQAGCDSVDGTRHAFAPSASTVEMDRYLAEATQPSLFRPDVVR